MEHTINAPNREESHMNWKTAYRSFYYQGAPEPEDLVLPYDETVMLNIDVQNIYMKSPEDTEEQERWGPFHRRMRETVIPSTRALQDAIRHHRRC